MSNYYYDLLADINSLSAFCPVIALVITKSKTRQDLRRVLYYLAVLWLFAECLNWILSAKGINNFLVLHSYDTLSTIGYLWLFKLVIPKYITKSVVVVIIVAYVSTIWLTIIFQDGYFETSTISNILTFVIPFLLSLLTFYSIAREAIIVDLMKEPIYWINAAIMIHFGLGLVANLSLEYVNTSVKLHLYIWPIVLASNIFHNIFFTVGVWKTNRV